MTRLIVFFYKKNTSTNRSQRSVFSYMAIPSDTELLHNIRQGDGDAFEAVYDRYGPLIYSLALQITNDQALAEEIVQDTFTKVWVSPELYNPERGRFSSWLLTMTRNIAIDALRKRMRKNRFSLLPPLMMQDADPVSSDALDEIERKELALVLRQGIHKLKPEQQELLQLTYWGGHSLSEVAQLQNVPLGTVKSRLHSALKALKRHLQHSWKGDRP